MVPAPQYESFDDLNAHLEEARLECQGDTSRGHAQSIGVRLMSGLDALMGLPVAEYEACNPISTRATSISMVRYRRNKFLCRRLIPTTMFTCVGFCMWSSLDAATRLLPATNDLTPLRK
jgi:hypothetical protein